MFICTYVGNGAAPYNAKLPTILTGNAIHVQCDLHHCSLYMIFDAILQTLGQKASSDVHVYVESTILDLGWVPKEVLSTSSDG